MERAYDFVQVGACPYGGVHVQGAAGSPHVYFLSSAAAPTRATCAAPPQVCGWFAARCDLILLLFDPYKLDISDEFRAVRLRLPSLCRVLTGGAHLGALGAGHHPAPAPAPRRLPHPTDPPPTHACQVIGTLKGHDDKVRVVLNKADSVDQQQLMRVYGALMWSLGKVFRSPEVCRVYIGRWVAGAWVARAGRQAGARGAQWRNAGRAHPRYPAACASPPPPAPAAAPRSFNAGQPIRDDVNPAGRTLFEREQVGGGWAGRHGRQAGREAGRHGWTALRRPLNPTPPPYRYPYPYPPIPQEDLLHDLYEIPARSCDRRVNEFVKRVRWAGGRVRHACAPHWMRALAPPPGRPALSPPTPHTSPTHSLVSPTHPPCCCRAAKIHFLIMGHLRKQIPYFGQKKAQVGRGRRAIACVCSTNGGMPFLTMHARPALAHTTHPPRHLCRRSFWTTWPPSLPTCSASSTCTPVRRLCGAAGGGLGPGAGAGAACPPSCARLIRAALLLWPSSTPPIQQATSRMWSGTARSCPPLTCPASPSWTKP